MSLIVDALKRAQQGAVRHLPPFGGGAQRPPRTGFPSQPSGGARRLILMTVAVAAIATGLWFGRDLFTPRARSITAGPPLFVVEPLPETPAPAPAEPVVAESTPAAAESADAVPASAPAAAPVVRRRPAPPRPIPPATAFVPPSVAPAAIPPATPAVVEVHTARAREAADALAAGLADQQRGDYAGAIAQYQRGIAADSRNPGLFNNMGLALKETGRLDAAAEAFEEALTIDPTYEKALNNLGVTRYQQARYEDAIDLFRRAIRVNPANVQSHVNLGVIFLPAGRWDEALGAFQDALRYDPASAEAHYNLGLLWERRGDKQRALPYYEKFVELADGRHRELAARVKEYLRQFERRR